MANPEHLKILNQGVEVWNQWRKDYHDTVPDLDQASLGGVQLENGVIKSRDELKNAYILAFTSELSPKSAHLSGINFRGASIRNADLSFANLHQAHLDHADLEGTQFIGSNLEGASFINTNLKSTRLALASFLGADLINACLASAEVGNARFEISDLESADFEGANLRGTFFCHSVLANARFLNATMGGTILAKVDLSQSKELETVEHLAPSTVGVDTLEKSRGKIPAGFLRGCGLSDWQIEGAKLHHPGLSKAEIKDITHEMVRLKGHQPIQLNPLFISYSHTDTAFVKALEPKFDEQGIRFWRDVHGLKAGRMETQIDRAIRLNPTVLVVLSTHSAESDWVEWEVRKARELEKNLGRDVLCPVALDEAWKSCSWPERLRVQVQEYNILDFSGWQNAATFERQFEKLLDGLTLFYKPTGK